MTATTTIIKQGYNSSKLAHHTSQHQERTVTSIPLAKGLCRVAPTCMTGGFRCTGLEPSAARSSTFVLISALRKACHWWASLLYTVLPLIALLWWHSYSTELPYNTPTIALPQQLFYDSVSMMLLLAMVFLKTALLMPIDESIQWQLTTMIESHNRKLGHVDGQ